MVPALYYIGCGLWCKTIDMDEDAKEAMHNLLVETNVASFIFEEKNMAEVVKRFSLPQNPHFLLNGYPIFSRMGKNIF